MPLDKSNIQPVARIKISHERQNLVVLVPWKNTVLLVLLGYLLFAGAGSFFALNLLNPSDLEHLRSAVYLYWAAEFLMVVFFATFCFNNTQIVAEPSHITFGPSPFPWGRSRRIEKSRIKNFTIQFLVNTLVQNNRRSLSYLVMAHLDSDEKILVCKLRSKEEALFVESTLENYYGLKDDPSLDTQGY